VALEPSRHDSAHCPTERPSVVDRIRLRHHVEEARNVGIVDPAHERVGIVVAPRAQRNGSVGEVGRHESRHLAPGANTIGAMATMAERSGIVDLVAHGLHPSGQICRNPTTATLYTHALERREAVLAEGGALVVDTGAHTGRSPNDKFVVREPASENRIAWGDVNAELAEDKFLGLRDKVVAHLEQCETVYVIDAFAGADPDHRISVRVVSDLATHALFAKTLFIEPTEDELEDFSADALVLHAPAVEADPEEDGTRSGTFVVVHPTRSEVLVGGTFYAGEIKKSIFTVMNDRLPLEASCRCTARPTSVLTAASRSSSASRERARRRSPPTRRAG
jgi:hypothetical protein